MDDGSSHDRKRNAFLLGMVLTWTLSIPVIIGMFHSFRGISETKATGLGAIAGGLAEGYATFGLILAFVLPVGAIVLLVRSFSGGHRMRALFSLLYICWSALMRCFSSTCPIQCGDWTAAYIGIYKTACSVDKAALICTARCLIELGSGR